MIRDCQYVNIMQAAGKGYNLLVGNTDNVLLVAVQIRAVGYIICNFIQA